MKSKNITPFEKMIFLEIIKLRYGKVLMPDYFLTYESLNDAERSRLNNYAAPLTKIAAFSFIDVDKDEYMLNEELRNMFTKLNLSQFHFEGKPFHKALHTLTGRTIEEF